MREELFWDRDAANVSQDVEIERAINFGGFDFIQQVQDRHGMERFTDVLMHSRNVSRKAVNYWCLVLGLDRAKARVFILLLVESLTFMEAIQHTLVNASLQHWIPAFAGMTCFTMPHHNQSYPRRRVSSQLSQGSAVELR